MKIKLVLLFFGLMPMLALGEQGSNFYSGQDLYGRTNTFRDPITPSVAPNKQPPSLQSTVGSSSASGGNGGLIFGNGGAESGGGAAQPTMIPIGVETNAKTSGAPEASPPTQSLDLTPRVPQEVNEAVISPIAAENPQSGLLVANGAKNDSNHKAINNNNVFQNVRRNVDVPWQEIPSQ